MVGQVCLDAGEAKNTYGTGNFLLLNTGEKMVRSENGLLTTVCYQFGDANPFTHWRVRSQSPASAVQWLRDQLGIISGAAQSEALAVRSTTTAGCTSCRHSRFVCGRTGVRTPRRIVGCRGSTPTRTWRARRLRRSATRAAIRRRDGGRFRRAPGGAQGRRRPPRNDLCMQIQADGLGVDVSSPVVAETTALGAAYAAGLAVDSGRNPDDLRSNWQEDKPLDACRGATTKRAAGYAGWQRRC